MKLPNQIQIGIAVAKLVSDDYLNKVADAGVEILTSSPVLTKLLTVESGMYLEIGPDRLDEIQQHLKDHPNFARALARTLALGVMIGQETAKLPEEPDTQALLDSLIGAVQSVQNRSEDRPKPAANGKRGGWK